MKSFSTGIRKVIKLRTNHFYKSTLVTPDHQYWVGDLSSTNQTTISSRGYAKLLDVQSKTTPKASKFKWQEIIKNNKCVSLLPNEIRKPTGSDFYDYNAKYVSDEPVVVCPGNFAEAEKKIIMERMKKGKEVNMTEDVAQ